MLAETVVMVITLLPARFFFFFSIVLVDMALSQNVYACVCHFEKPQIL